MGQLNSNEVPPNPFVHGWREAVHSTPPPLRQPPLPPRVVPTVSPLEQAYQIVSQPLQPTRHSTTRQSISGLPVGFILAAGLIIVLAIVFFFAAVSKRQDSQTQSSIVTNQVSIPAKQNRAATPLTLSPQTPPIQNYADAASSGVSSAPVIASTASSFTAEPASKPVEVVQVPVETPDSSRALVVPAPEQQPPIQVRQPTRELPLLPDPPMLR